MCALLKDTLTFKSGHTVLHTNALSSGLEKTWLHELTVINRAEGKEPRAVHGIEHREHMLLDIFVKACRPYKKVCGQVKYQHL